MLLLPLLLLVSARVTQAWSMHVSLMTALAFEFVHANMARSAFVGMAVD
jgi:hypothetical protein